MSSYKLILKIYTHFKIQKLEKIMNLGLFMYYKTILHYISKVIEIQIVVLKDLLRIIIETVSKATRRFGYYYGGY